MITIADAILAININAEVNIRGDNLDTCEIEWMNGTAEISKADIKTKMAELQTTYDNNKYQRDRAKEYPYFGEQFDKLYHDITAGKLDATGEWYKSIKAIKDKYPKE